MEISVSSNNKITFSVTRNDLLFNFATKFEDVFRFTVGADDALTSQQGVRLQEALGYDFQNECNPIVEIVPPGELIEAATGQSAESFAVFVTIEDVALSVRRVIQVIDVADIQEVASYKIDLNSFADMGFYRGFVLKCFIARKSDVGPESQIIWSKSQIVYESEFIVKSTVDEALFEIAWTTFNDPAEKKNVLFFVDWSSNEVSSAPHIDCFQVKANNDAKSQFKRLENNPVFGELCIRMVAERIISDLAENALRCAELDMEPLEGSLHEKMRSLFNDLGLDFDLMAHEYQQGDKQDQLSVVSRVSRAIQRYTQIAHTLSAVKFGGYRKS
jgi:hypothetical protein